MPMTDELTVEMAPAVAADSLDSTDDSDVTVEPVAETAIDVVADSVESTVESAEIWLDVEVETLAVEVVRPASAVVTEATDELAAEIEAELPATRFDTPVRLVEIAVCVPDTVPTTVVSEATDELAPAAISATEDSDELIEVTELVSETIELLAVLKAPLSDPTDDNAPDAITETLVRRDRVDEEPVEIEESALLSNELVCEIELASDETWLEIDDDSSAVNCAYAAPVPSHDVTPILSPGRCSGAPSAWSTTADEPSMRVAFSPR